MSVGRTKKAVKNITYNFLNQLLNLMLAFLSRTVFIRTLGAEYLGINGLFSDVLGLLSLADLGFNTAMVYSFYEPLAQNNHEKMAALTSFYKKVYKIIAIFTGIGGIMLLPVLPFVINLENDVPHLYIYYLISVANIVASYLCVYKTSILTADQKNYDVIRIAMITNILKTFIQVGVLILIKGYLLYLIIGVFFSVLNNWIASKKASKIYPFIEQEKILKKEEKKDIISNVNSVFVYKVSSVLLNATDNVLISSIVGTVAVGYYSNYLMLSNKLTQFYSLFFASLIASIGNLVVNENAQKRYQIFQCEQIVSCIMSCIIFPCYILLANDFIDLWLGDNYILPENVVYAIGLNLYLACIYHPLWSYREATGLYKKTKWVMLLCGVVNIVLSILLGLKFGLFGILFASCISRLLTYVWIEPHILFKEYFDCSSVTFFRQILLNMIIVVIIILLGKLISIKIEVYSWISWIFKATIIAFVGLFIAIVAYRNSYGFKRLKGEIKKIWSK